jgi:hypothetical protein
VRRSSVPLAFVAALALAWAACSSFSEGEGDADGGAGDAQALETSVPDAGTASSTSVAVDEPTEIVLGADPAFLYIATGRSVAPL